jgi:hypothetical protein
MTTYTQYHGRQVLPAAGGWLDQSAGWAEAVVFVDGERAWWEAQKERREAGGSSHAEAKAKEEARRKALYGRG